MNTDKTVTMNYRDHERLVKENEEFEKSKLCVLRVVDDSDYHMFQIERVSFLVNSSEELENVVKQIVRDEASAITSPLETVIMRLQGEIVELNREIRRLEKVSPPAAEMSAVRKFFTKYF